MSVWAEETGTLDGDERGDQHAEGAGGGARLVPRAVDAASDVCGAVPQTADAVVAPAAPPVPHPWPAEYNISDRPRIHTGDCTMHGQRVHKISEQDARQGIADVGACQFCRPDTVLGILE
ncbi:DUF6233 domain-containing protein [Streptomyces sp. NPDC052236]|uniref:DUF6233 domain-containing protein n=1 Tax=Streptomyces sp. NPDC052236 TaxID=3365686 RepID=UPI0037D2B7AB